MECINCLIYMALLGVLCFPVGRLFARIPFRTQSFPFRPYRVEQNGKIYEKLHIRFWKNRVPDVSRMFSKIVPGKNRSGGRSAANLERMVRETCVAELTHTLLCVFGLVLPVIWPGWGGRLLCLTYILFGNIPFIIIQRYNRPRLQRLLAAAGRKESGRQPYEDSDSQL